MGPTSKRLGARKRGHASERASEWRSYESTHPYSLYRKSRKTHRLHSLQLNPESVPLHLLIVVFFFSNWVSFFPVSFIIRVMCFRNTRDTRGNFDYLSLKVNYLVGLGIPDSDFKELLQEREFQQLFYSSFSQLCSRKSWKKLNGMRCKHFDPSSNMWTACHCCCCY